MTTAPNLDPNPTGDEHRRGLDLAMQTFPAGYDRDSLALRAAKMFAADRVRLLTPPPVLKVRVIIERDAWTGWNGQQIEAKTLTQDFDNFADATDWAFHDGYIGEAYTKRVLIEKVEVPA